MDSLSQQDMVIMLEMIHDSLSCVSEASFRVLFDRLKKLIHHEYAACLMVRQSPNGIIVGYDFINISYPAEWTNNYMAKKYHQVDPVFRENFSNFPLQFWKDTYRKTEPPKSFIKEAQDFGLREGYSIGQRTLDSAEGSLFSFSGRTVQRDSRTAIIMRHVAPHLHQAFIRLLKQTNDREMNPLTLREQEVLLWVKEGKSTWDISVILGISQDTVKYHIKRIFRKLNTNNRTHAIAIALDKKILGF